MVPPGAWQDEGVHLHIDVRFYGFVRDVVDPSSFVLEAPQSATLRELLDLLVEKFGERLRERLLTKTGELEANVRVFVGDSQTSSLEEPIKNGQESFTKVKVFVLSATAGG
ncbi:MAG: MoaD/ThiS family protein [Candidatus Binatia bacterium]